jgi:pentatricopeptide repeat protein
MKFHISFLKKSIYLLPVLLIFGCSVWRNFTTYFNLYYNTSDIFSQAEESINSQKQDLFSTEELKVPGSALQLLNKVIEKASQILQFHRESAYVDDALLMLGKSFYYQKNYLKSVREFQELIATQPNSDLILEAKLWIGKADLNLKKYDEALSILETVKKQGIDEGKNDIVADAYIEEVKYKLIHHDYAGAVTSSKELLNFSKNDERNAEIEFEMGKLYELLDDPENAILSFQKVFDYSPTFEIEFGARLELGKAYREAGNPQKALSIFNEMKSNKIYSDSYDQIDLQTGITEVSLGNYETALSYFKTVDTSFANSQSAGFANYHLGELYQYNIPNYDSASYYYSKALSSRLPADYIIPANEKIQRFRKYKTLKDNISQDNKKLEYVENPESFIRDSVAFYTVDTVKNESEAETNTGTSVSRGNTRGRFNDQRFAEFNKSENQTTKTAAKQNKTGVPPIRPNISADSINSLLAQSLFELGNLFFTEFNLPDSAYYYYTTILDSFPDSRYQARTMYALGSYYETENQNSKADSLYNLIYNNYKNESIVNAAASKLNKPLINFDYDPAVDLYATAEKKFMSKEYKESLHEFYNIYKSYPQSALAPKALYASGWILANQLNSPDSAAIFYDSLQAKYPKTVYAIKIRQEVDFYNQEKERIQKAREDSLKQIEQARLDSLRADSLRTHKNISPNQFPSDSTGIIKKPSGNQAKPDTFNNAPNPDIERREERRNRIDSIRGNRREIPDTLKRDQSRISK